MRTHEINYVPECKQKDFINNIFENFLKPDGRLIIGSYSEDKNDNTFENYIGSLGFIPSGYSKRSYGNKERKILWFDKKA